MTAPPDDSATFSDYAHPERLVSTGWLADRLDAGNPEGIVVVESDEDVLLYDTGHIPGAVKVDWHVDLNDPLTRDYVDGARFAEILGARGIGRATTVVIYGDKSNWWAAYALWVFSLFGHDTTALMDGGRQKWIAEGRPRTTDVPQRTPSTYPTRPRDDTKIRAFQSEVMPHVKAGGKLVDPKKRLCVFFVTTAQGRAAFNFWLACGSLLIGLFLIVVPQRPHRRSRDKFPNVGDQAFTVFMSSIRPKRESGVP